MRAPSVDGLEQYPFDETALRDLAELKRFR